MKTWFKTQAKGDIAEIAIYDEIGMWGVTAKDFIGELKAHSGKNVSLSINSPGGSVFDALAIYNALRAHEGTVTVKVLGIAASAASLIAMAGDKIVMPENTFMMVHNPWTFAMGNAEELRDVAATLDTIGSSLVKTYMSRTGLGEDEINELLAKDTWLTAEEAVALGFATEMEPALKVAASYDTDRLPENIRGIFNTANDAPPVEDPLPAEDSAPEDAPPVEEEAPVATFAEQVVALANKAGLTEYAAAFALNASIKTLEDAQARISAAREIHTLCAIAKLPQMASKLIREDVSLDDARAQLCSALAEQDDAIRVSNHLPTSADPKGGADVWSKIFPQRQTKE